MAITSRSGALNGGRIRDCAIQSDRISSPLAIAFTARESPMIPALVRSLFEDARARIAHVSVPRSATSRPASAMATTSVACAKSAPEWSEPTPIGSGHEQPAGNRVRK